MPLALYALTIGAFGIGLTEFIIMGLLMDIAHDFHVSVASAGLLISGYALSVTFGAPLLTIITAYQSKKLTPLGLMVLFIIGNAVCAIAPTYEWLMAGRLITALTHGTFFGVGAIAATNLVCPDKRASAIATMFTGLTIATVLGVPLGTWIGQQFGWRTTFWTITFLGFAAFFILALLLPKGQTQSETASWQEDLRAIAQRPVLLGLLTTVLGYASVFSVFTYIAPLLTEISGFDKNAVSPILIVFGGGLIVGNFVGGKLGDMNLIRSISITLTTLAIILALMTFSFRNQVASIVFVGLLGASGFATVAPLQLWVLSKIEGSGQSLASTFNIGAFNLGNALGAWIGGFIIDHGPGIIFIPLFAAIFPLAAMGLAVISQKNQGADIDKA